MSELIKVLTLTQPWATLCAISAPDDPAKNIETRSWSTNYRGPIGIHAAKGFPLWAQECCDDEPFKSRLRGLRAKALPRGVLLCIRSLDLCVKTKDVNHLPSLFMGKQEFKPLTDMERAFGDYGEGRFAWFLGPVTRKFDPPLQVTGSLGLWNLRLP